ncbi:MAG: UDP-glucose--hexose-1-phosphate uridylyltransferase [Candidatus Izemoplasmatales bacterium]|jgi:UDPglucose--hexose-1-phosphate uridylyltransferase
MINNYVNQLVQYAFDCHLLETVNYEYALNNVLYLLRLDHFEHEDIEDDIDFFRLMDKIMEYAVKHAIIDDSESSRDNLEGKLMDSFIGRPSEIDQKFWQLYDEDPYLATQWFYDLSQATNYIKTERIKKNILFKYVGKYAPLDITINLSKPEKDPQLIAQAKATDDYPQCALCMENIGFYGTDSKPPRSNHRVISLSINGDDNEWGFQYSPYSYFNEHAIVLKKIHEPMRVDYDTFCELIDFVNQFPHYLMGSNAGLPIVGGSILSHYHFQGGRYEFPIEKAHILKAYYKKKVRIEILKWPLSAIRIIGSDARYVLEMVNRLFENWKEYSNDALGIHAKTQKNHNTVTPILKYIDGEYNFYLVLRNNYTDKNHPYGLFHPREEYFHIKKENIGLIEVMGLAVLPGRLQTEINQIKTCLLAGTDPKQYPELEKHLPWFNELKMKAFDASTIDILLQQEVGLIFEKVLEDCGVFKADNLDAFCQFVANAL